jgi:branched-chain amino acid transport system permease protein
MTEFLSFTILGIPYGCVFALMAVGLVLTYQTSGVFNLGFGAQAYVAALVFYKGVAAGWPKWLAFVVAVGVVSPAIGIGSDRLLFRHVRSSPVLVKMVAALALMLAVPSVVQIAFPNSQTVAPPAVLLGPSTVYFRLGPVPIDGTELSTVVVTAVAVLLLALLFHFTQVGLRMRAMAESARMVQLTGVNAERVGAATWALSGLLAGLAGVLLAPPLGQVQWLGFTELLVAGGITAAAAGGLTSLPLAFAGGIGVGMGQELLGGYLPSGSVLASGARLAFPFVALVVLVLFMPGLRRRWTSDQDPLSAVDPPPPPLAAAIRGRALERVMLIGWRVVLAAFVVSTLTWVPADWRLVFILGIALSVICLSITLLTGMSGQISLCQMAFAGAGAFTAGQLATHLDLSVLVGIVVGGVVAAALGALVALPALRLGGLALAIATLAFGFLADNIGFQYSWSGGGLSGVSVPRPRIATLDFGSDRAFFLLALVVLLLAATVVRLVRRGTTGRYLAAMRGSELGAASVGIDVNRLKIVVFALSAGLAGVGGALYGSALQNVSPDNFSAFFSLVLVLVVVTTGVSTVEGAIQAGMAYEVITQILGYLPPRWVYLLQVVFGAGAITYSLHPEGIVELQRRLWIERFERMRDRLGRQPPPAPPPGGRRGPAPVVGGVLDAAKGS